MSQTAPRRSQREKKPSLKAQEVADQANMASTAAPNTSKKRKATATASVPAKKLAAQATKKSTATKTAAAKKPAAGPSTAKKATKVAAPKAPAAEASSSKKAAKATKRKAAEEESDAEEEAREPPKKKLAAKVKAPPKKAAINEAPTTKQKVFVFGEGSAGELALGHKRAAGGPNIKDVKRPRLNANLSSEEVGVVQIAVGGMHCVALINDNTILTWGVNDQGTLGRDTKDPELIKQFGNDGDDDDSDDDEDLNPLEARALPISLDNIPEGTIFTSVSASDSCSFAVTSEGYVYGCGTFRSNEGILGFSTDKTIETKFSLVPALKNVSKVVCGTNHAMALDSKGNVVAWGAGQQNQLGRRVVERTRMNGLVPREFGLPRGKVVDIFAGAYHSFAIDKDGNVWSWGLNSFGQTGCADDLGEDSAVVLKPKKVEALKGMDIKQIDGGSQHTLALTKEGELFGFGRVDGDQLGMDPSTLSDDDVVKDDHGRVRIVSRPTAIPNVPLPVAFVATGPDHNLVITEQGKAWSWGFSANYQTGVGSFDDQDTAVPMENTATKDEKLVWAGAGGQFGLVASAMEE